jgi:hypothetical protein
VREAERLFQQGRFQQAARLFEELARKTARRGMWQEATQLQIRGVQALLEGGYVDTAVEQARRTLVAMKRAGRPARTRVFFHRVIRELEKRGYHAQAEALRQEIAEKLGREPGRPGYRRPRYQFPTNCPNCSAALKEGEYRQVRPETIECSFCGTLISGTEQER